MNKLTVSFVLPSGVPCVCTELYGDHYDILTSKRFKGEDMMLEFILSLMVSVGSKTFKKNAEFHAENKKFIQAMRAKDKEHILATVRQASMDYEKSFEFIYKYQDSNGANREKLLKVTLNDSDSEATLEHLDNLGRIYGVEHKDFYKELNKDGTFYTTPSIDRATEYADLPPFYLVELPKTGKTVRVDYLTGKGELFLSKQNKLELSVNSLISARFPQYKDGESWIHLRLGDLPMKDLSILRKEIKKREGAVDLELTFNNPDKESDERKVTKNLITETAFFFPSGAVG